MIFIRTKPYNLPSYDAIEEFESVFTNFTIENEIENRFVRKIIQKSIEYYPSIFNMINKIPRKKYDNIFTILMASHDIYKIFPSSFYSKSTNLYIYDLWEKDYSYLEKILDKYHIDNIFLSSKQTAEFLSDNSHIKSTNFYWIPEGIAENTYKFFDYKDKDIDIVSFGRKYDSYHNKILEYTRENNFNYIYQKDKPVFSNRDEFTNGLARAKISLCFPASTTNNNTQVSKLTMRYLQSMASKCLIIGKNPDDMKFIFDYNPLIEADEKNPNEQLHEILNNYEKYIPLIEKNYNEVMSKHLYKNRLVEILNIIENNKK